MARRKYRLLKVLGWIVGGLISLILLVTLVFYLGRNFFMGKAVAYVNEKQAGEVQMGKMKLIPFINFPDITLQLESVNYFEKEIQSDTSARLPIVSMNSIHVTLDVVDLIRGDIMISEAKLDQGRIRLEIYEDSVSNLEYALGIRLGDQESKDTTGQTPAISIDLDAIEISEVSLQLENQVRDERFELKVNQLESSFSYLNDLINANIELDVEINHVKYLTFNEKGERNVVLNGSIIMNPLAKEIEVKPSKLRVSGLDFETWGTYNYQGIPSLDFAYKATNEGLEVLNFLFRGVLDLDEIEQIGSGTMRLSGDVKGNLGEELPVIRLNGDADELGFRINALQKDVSGISFNVFATNGSQADLSESYMDITGFRARFPEGRITANATVRNIKSPELNIEVDGRLNLEGMEQMLKTEFLSDLVGQVHLKGSVNGRVDRKNGEFLNDSGKLSALLDGVGFVMHRDSLTVDSIKQLQGEVFVTENKLGAEKLSLEYNGNQLEVSAITENLLLYLLKFDKDVKAELSLSSDTLKLASLFKDTASSQLLGEELHGLHFGVSAKISNEDLDEFLKADSIPQINLTLDSFGIEFPLMADISEMNASLTFGPDTISLHKLEGTIGESEFGFSGLLANYGLLTHQDSTGILSLDFSLESEQMRAEDIFTFKNEFLLPETYSTEYLEDFRLHGSLDLPAEGLLHDSVPLDFSLDVEDMAWNFRYYPLSFEQFLVHLRRSGDQLFIDALEGRVGESNLKMTASINNFTDSLENMSGNLVLESDLLDFNALLNYQIPDEIVNSAKVDSSEIREPPRLDQVSYPNFDFTLDIEEMRYGEFNIYGMNGSLRSTREKIFILDSFLVSSEGGGTLELNGHFNVSNQDRYLVGAELELKDMDINDIGLELQSGDETYTLSETFKGVISAEGLVEMFVSPDLKVDIPSTTAMFNVTVNDGELINFTPLQAAGKFLDNKNLDHVIFATLSHSFTLMDSKIIFTKNMAIESSIGLMVIKGEQGLDGSFLYLLHIPTQLAKEAAKSVMSAENGGLESNEVQRMQRGDFLIVTVWSNGTESDYKLGDKRDKFRE